MPSWPSFAPFRQVQYRTLFLNSRCGGILFIRPALWPELQNAATSGPLPIGLACSKKRRSAVPTSRGPISLIALGKMHAATGEHTAGALDRIRSQSIAHYFGRQLTFIFFPKNT